MNQSPDGWKRQALRIGVVWAITSLAYVCFGLYDGNEVDVLPFARQQFDTAWLPQDWYLNIDVGYRGVFNVVVGWLVSTFGFDTGAAIGRGLAHGVVAWGFVSICGALRLPLRFAIPGFLVFLRFQDLVAYEFVVGGVDTKSFAYAAIFLALAAFARGRPVLASLWSGIAISFHMLVGLYALCCLGGAALFVSAGRPRSHRQWILSATALGLAGLPGWLAILAHLQSESAGIAANAWSIYVNYRLPYRLVPAGWRSASYWLPELAIGALAMAMSWRREVSPAARTLAFVGLASAGFFVIGLAIAAFGPHEWLRFYWFRFGDVMVPFTTTTLVSHWLATKLQTAPVGNAGGRRAQYAGTTLAALGLFLTFTFVPRPVWYGSNEILAARPLLHWVREHTPRDAVFLVSPMWAEFYLEAERAMVVSFVHSPQSAPEILEWYDRILAVNGGVAPREKGFASHRELSDRFFNLTPAQVIKVAGIYGATHFIGRADKPLPFEVVKRNRSFVVYELPRRRSF